MRRSGSWYHVLTEPLPEVARRAGREVLRGLAAKLARRAARGEDPAMVMGRLVIDLARERDAVRRASADDLLTLRAASSLGAVRTVVDAIVRRTARPGALAGDLRAMDRLLDSSAAEDRLALARHRVDQPLELLALALAAQPLGGVPPTLSEPLIGVCAAVGRDRGSPWPVRVATVRALAALGRIDAARGALAGPPLAALGRAHGEDPWVQAAALEGLSAVDPVAVGPLLDAALHAPPLSRHRDHRFARARAARTAGAIGRFDLLGAALAGPEDSEHVRIEAARALASSTDPADRGTLTDRLADAAHPDGWRVATAGALAIVDAALAGGSPTLPALSALAEALLAQPSPNAVHTLLQGMWTRAAHGRLRPLVPALSSAWERPLARWSEEDVAPDTRRLARVLRVWLGLVQAPATAVALDTLGPAIRAAREGEALRFPRGPVATLSGRTLLDCLFVLAHDDIDLGARPLGGPVDDPEQAPPEGWEVYVGLAIERTPWRVVHELTHARNDKRQAWLHTTDEIPRGPLIAWSGRMAEVVATDVPGRRVSTPVTVSWNEHLPLPANLITAAREGVVRARTVDGDVIVRRSARGAGVAAQRRYVHLAELRTRLGDLPAAEAAARWDQEVGRLGFTITREPTWALTPLSLFGLSPERAGWELGAVAAGSLAFWAAARAVREARARRWRSQLGLVVGGWGSRGKSSVERMKAALFLGLGYTVVCKSTGCEAMLLLGIPGCDPVETFLYRPRDKATIVEQQDVMRFSATMGAQVTLYECMALNPLYTSIIQHGWMRDDATTITNTYPDHEDIQGPSGRDVADVISTFVPTGGHLVTSEQQMTPVLARRARSRGSTIDVAGPEDWDLLPRDLLDRFPDRAYDRNVALVARLAEALGIPRDVAIRAMADHVLIDLGAFRRYGPLDVDGRQVCFWNGCSANDRASFLSNWERAGLSTFDERSGQDRFLVTVFNNRADRLARQAIFARIGALDVSADRIVIIGTNVLPMADAIHHAIRHDLRERLQDLSRRPAARDALRRMFSARLRRHPLAPDVLVTRMPPSPGPVTQAWAEEVTWLHGLSQTNDWDVEAAIDAFLGFFARRVTPFPDSAMKGDEVLGGIAGLFPEGASVDILGSENIKGTGLDFVYRWMSADKVSGWLNSAATGDLPTAREALTRLASWGGWGRHDARQAMATLRTWLDDGTAASRGLLDEVEAACATAAAARRQAEAGKVTRGGRWAGLKAWWRSFDVLGSIRRRWAADALYRDLAARRVGMVRAGREAQRLVEAEKG